MNDYTSLYPLPGSKRAKKYNLLRPSRHHFFNCEPFAGGASESIKYNLLPTYLGEINPAARAILVAARDFPEEFIESYTATRAKMIDGIDWTDALTYVGRKAAQKHLKRDMPEIWHEGRRRWIGLKKELWAIQDQVTGQTAGAAMFQILAAFGNIGFRMNPNETGFNISWHIDKLDQAMRFCPRQWVDFFQSINWSPNVFPSWQEAILAQPGPNTYLLLDPPYCVDGELHRMTPCYRDHKTGTTKMSEPTLELSTKPLLMALELGYTDIHLCNYWSDRLASDVQDILAGTSYNLTLHPMGKCGALGNSAGRLEHGNRQDGRDRPIEWIWEISRDSKARASFEQLGLGLAA
jgi:hypothetical protein